MCLANKAIECFPSLMETHSLFCFATLGSIVMTALSEKNLKHGFTGALHNLITSL